MFMSIDLIGANYPSAWRAPLSSKQYAFRNATSGAISRPKSKEVARMRHRVMKYS